MKKGFATILILGIIAAIAIAAGTFFLVRKPYATPLPPEPTVQAQASPRPTPTDETANWKTFIHSSKKFSFKYPDNVGAYETNSEYSDVSVRFKYPSSPDGCELCDGYMLSFKMGKLDQQTLQQFAEEKLKEIEKYEGNIEKPLKPTNIYKYAGLSFSYALFANSTNIYLKSDKNEYIEIRYSIDDPQNRGYQKTVDQILASFKFLDPTETANVKSEHVLIAEDFSFDIQIPAAYTIKKYESNNSLTKDAARIYDENEKQVLYIYTYAAGERTPKGSLVIDGVPFTINYFDDIQCGADLDATNWVPGTKPLFGILVSCEQANRQQLDQYKGVIQSIKFSPALKTVLMGKI